MIPTRQLLTILDSVKCDHSIVVESLRRSPWSLLSISSLDDDAPNTVSDIEMLPQKSSCPTAPPSPQSRKSIQQQTQYNKQHNYVDDNRNQNNNIVEMYSCRFAYTVTQCVACLRRCHALARQIRQFIFENAIVNDLTSATTTTTIMSRRLVERLIHVENGFAQVEHTADVLNRSSVKLAEMDAATAILATGMKLHFVDLCCAPGGFLDYVFLRKRWSATGMGVTLARYREIANGNSSVGLTDKASADGGGLLFDANRIRTSANNVPVYYCDITRLAARVVTERRNGGKNRERVIKRKGHQNPSSIEEQYVSDIINNDIREDNRRGIESSSSIDVAFAHLNTKRRKVTLVLADGASCGEDVQNSSLPNLELILAQWTIAKFILRRGGNLLLKTFSWYNDDPKMCNAYTLNVLRSIVIHFQSFVVLKPWHSRITNDERYIYFRSFAVTPRMYDFWSDEMSFLHAEWNIVQHQVRVYRRIRCCVQKLQRQPTTEQFCPKENTRRLEIDTVCDLVTNDTQFRWCVTVANKFMRRYAIRDLRLPVISVDSAAYSSTATSQKRHTSHKQS